MPKLEDFEWTGEYDTVTYEEYWCPTDQRWSTCPSPCPDGTPHEPSRNEPHQVKVMRRKDG